MKIKLLLAIVAATSAFYVTEASACSSGFIADLACNAGLIDKQTANTLDGLHAAAGRPIETQIIPGVADSFVPGSGAVLRGYDQFNRNGGFGGPVGQPAGNPGFPVQTAAYPQQNIQPMGVFCGTPFGNFGPGMPAPLGSFCTAATPVGLVQGRIM